MPDLLSPSSQHEQARLLHMLQEQRRPGWTLSQESYFSPEIFALEMSRIFRGTWIFATHSCEVPTAGSFKTLQLGRDPLVLVRGQDGVLRGFYNVCRHRGSRVMMEDSGVARQLVCPYHQWTYDHCGNLKSARFMGDDFKPAECGLRSFHVEEVEGLVFICLATGEAPDFASAAAAFAPQMAPHELTRTQVAARHNYTVQANWKLLIENNRECYHCRGAHPEFCLSNYDFGLPGDKRGADEYQKRWDEQRTHWERLGLKPRDINFPGNSFYRVSRLPLRPGFVTETIGGGRAAPLLGRVQDENTGSLRIIALPNLWAHVNCDYAMTTRLLPLDERSTAVEVTFLVRAGARPGVDYDPVTIETVWKATSEQDWRLCENNQAGALSAAYDPGPYSPVMESSISSFIDGYWYPCLLGSSRA
jgi:Rieske 2Fe-2S family protein